MFRVGVASRFGLLYNYQNESRRRPVGFLILRQGDIGLLQVVQSLVDFDNMNIKRFREPVTRLNPSPPYAKMVFPWPTPPPLHPFLIVAFMSKSIYLLVSGLTRGCKPQGTTSADTDDSLRGHYFFSRRRTG
jgi:hypothetical protein